MYNERKDERVFFSFFIISEPEFQDFFVFPFLVLRYGCSFLNFPQHISHMFIYYAALYKIVLCREMRVNNNFCDAGLFL